jgi:hypothetical protein
VLVVVGKSVNAYRAGKPYRDEPGKKWPLSRQLDHRRPLMAKANDVQANKTPVNEG